MLRPLIAHVVAHPRRWLWLVGLATIVAAAGLPQLRLDTGGRALHPPGERVVLDSEADALSVRAGQRQLALDPHAAARGVRAR